MIDFLRTDTFLIILFILNIILLISSIISNIRIKNIHKNNKEFMIKLGNGKDIKEDLEFYMNRVRELEDVNKQILKYLQDLTKQTERCIQKVGTVRYNAYDGMGSNLSFAIALLDANDDGVVINGIYSRDASSIYAKPIQNGKSTYAITPEENEAINRAKNTIIRD